jgi:hypothetical protein
MGVWEWVSGCKQERQAGNPGFDRLDQETIMQRKESRE